MMRGGGEGTATTPGSGLASEVAAVSHYRG
jgi:hypothetical protein